MPVLSHLTLGSNDQARSAAFYDAVLGVLGFSPLPKPPEKALAYQKGDQLPLVYIGLPIDDRPATWGNGTHIAFMAESRAAVDEFYNQAMAKGGLCEGPPGLRPHYSSNYYAAYVRDPDGNKLQAVCYQEA